MAGGLCLGLAPQFGRELGLRERERRSSQQSAGGTGLPKDGRAAKRTCLGDTWATTPAISKLDKYVHTMKKTSNISKRSYQLMEGDYFAKFL